MNDDSPKPEGGEKFLHRRDFVKRSVAASILASQPVVFSGLLRAEGGGGGQTTTTGGWTTTGPESTTVPWTTTGGETTTGVETTTDPVTTPQPASKLYSSTVYLMADGVTWTTNAALAGTFAQLPAIASPAWDDSKIPATDLWGNNSISDPALWPTALTPPQRLPSSGARSAQDQGLCAERPPICCKFQQRLDVRRWLQGMVDNDFNL